MYMNNSRNEINFRKRTRSPYIDIDIDNINNDKNKKPRKLNFSLPPLKSSRIRPYTPDNFFSIFDDYGNLDDLEKLENYSKKDKKDEVKKEEKKKEIECKNPLCNHKTLSEDPTPIIPLKMECIQNIDDLIELGKTYHCKKNTEFNKINLRLLCNLVQPLTELKNLIGMKTVKENIVNQILFFIQGFNKTQKCNKCIDCSYNLPCVKNTEDMLHTVISGPPGVGKTELGKILAKVYKEMGILSKGHFITANRSDLIGKYLGHTAEKTQNKINEALGGVLFIDEAYSLGHKENRDSFSKECIDTINQNLTEKRDLLVIIAGYEDQLEQCFFKVNEGLNRRFTFRYNIDKYDAEELQQIFLGKVKMANWTMVKNEDTTEFFKKNVNSFPNFGGDIETLFLNAKIHNGRRMVFSSEPPKTLSKEDVENGFKKFLHHRKNNNTITYNYNSLWI